jgi:hypothetical protein
VSRSRIRLRHEIAKAGRMALIDAMPPIRVIFQSCSIRTHGGRGPKTRRMTLAVRRAAFCGLLLVLFLCACDDDTTRPTGSTGLQEYVGDFECDDLDGDRAVLLYDEDAEAGWFGWLPSNGGANTYVMRPIDGPSFTVTFNNVYGADHSGETETLTFNGTLSLDGKTISGTGTVTREDASVESCEFSFSRP